MTSSIPQFLCDLLRSPPRAGEGVHPWLFRVARQLHVHLPAGEIVRVLETQTANCGRHVSRAEILAAVQNSLPCAWQPRESFAPNQPPRLWPEMNRGRREAITASGRGLVDLWEASPIRIEDSNNRSEAMIDLLFPGNPLLCCGQSKSVFDTKPREDWRGQLAGLQFVVPSPMSAPLGRKKNPKPGESEWSAHTLGNTGPRRFLVVEFDTGTADEHAGLILHLAGFGPLLLAVHSGGKSLHGWFYCAGQPEDKLHRFMRYAVSLGADYATWTRSQFVRIPDGTRENGKRQTVFFFNPKPIKL
jgi:hypothetical protein